MAGQRRKPGLNGICILFNGGKAAFVNDPLSCTYFFSDASLIFIPHNKGRGDIAIGVVSNTTDVRPLMRLTLSSVRSRSRMALSAALPTLSPSSVNSRTRRPSTRSTRSTSKCASSSRNERLTAEWAMPNVRAAGRIPPVS